MKVGLIGCGEISKFHMEVYNRLKDVEVVAVSDLLLDRVKNFAQKWGVGKYFVNYQDLLEIEDLDLVDICTPVWTHSKIAIDTAKSGHEILLEKPMALSSKECDEMIKTAKEHNVKLCVNHHSLFNPSIKRAKTLVESGYFDIQSVEVTFYKNLYIEKLPAWAYKSEYGGLLWEVGTHPTYITQHFLENIKKVYATGKKSKSVYDGFSVLLHSSNDSFGVMNFSFTSNYREYTCRLTSQNGNSAKIFISYDAFLDQSKFISNTPIKFLKEQKDHFVNWTKAALRTLYHNNRNYDFINSKYLLMKSYIESIQEKSQPPVTGEDAKSTIILLESIKKSLETGDAVPIN